MISIDSWENFYKGILFLIKRLIMQRTKHRIRQIVEKFRWSVKYISLPYLTYTTPWDFSNRPFVSTPFFLVSIQSLKYLICFYSCRESVLWRSSLNSCFEEFLETHSKTPMHIAVPGHKEVYFLVFFCSKAAIRGVL